MAGADGACVPAGSLASLWLPESRRRQGACTGDGPTRPLRAARPVGRAAVGHLAGLGEGLDHAVWVAGAAALPMQSSIPAERVRPWAFGGQADRAGTGGPPGSLPTTRRCWVLWHEPPAGSEVAATLPRGPLRLRTP
eukprot:12730484-Alexandrium_andersonii.AAC.1